MNERETRNDGTQLAQYTVGDKIEFTSQSALLPDKCGVVKRVETDHPEFNDPVYEVKANVGHSQVPESNILRDLSGDSD